MRGASRRSSKGGVKPMKKKVTKEQIRKWAERFKQQHQSKDPEQLKRWLDK